MTCIFAENWQVRFKMELEKYEKLRISVEIDEERMRWHVKRMVDDIIRKDILLRGYTSEALIKKYLRELLFSKEFLDELADVMTKRSL